MPHRGAGRSSPRTHPASHDSPGPGGRCLETSSPLKGPSLDPMPTAMASPLGSAEAWRPCAGQESPGLQGRACLDSRVHTVPCTPRPHRDRQTCPPGGQMSPVGATPCWPTARADVTHSLQTPSGDREALPSPQLRSAGRIPGAPRTSPAPPPGQASTMSLGSGDERSRGPVARADLCLLRTLRGMRALGSDQIA